MLTKHHRRTLYRAGRKVLLFAVVLAFVFQTVPLGLSAKTPSGGGDDDRGFRHVFVIMMENTGFDSLIGNPNAPFINYLAAAQGLATNYFGVTHPSQPNYIAATSGSTNGVPNDNDITIDVPNIVDQLEAHGKTWKGYMQSFSLCVTPLDHACGNQLYERKHNPFVSYQDVQSSASRLVNIVDFSQFATDLANNTVPDYSWISPDQCHDMHGRGGGGASDPCDFSQVQGLIATGDLFLTQTVSAIVNSHAWRGNSVIFITWDESDFTGSGPFGFGDTSGCCDANPGGGHVVTLVISREAPFAHSSGRAYNHYSMMATIEDSWHLGCLAFTCDKKNVKPMFDLAGGDF
jgi:phosphatidylinositol-3-phosphatase